jgi:glycosyltransferase involved in cell wall biosynthesis
MSTARRPIRPPGAVAPAVLLAALDQRLTAAAALVLDPADLDHGLTHGGGASAHLLPLLVAACADHDRVDVRWLTLTAAFGAFPTPQQVLDFGRMVELTDPMHAESTLLAGIIAQPRRGRLDLPMRTVSDAVVVEVNYCAKHSTHTGIQRTVRETMPRWAALHDITTVAWADPWCAFRTLTPTEHRRVFEHAETPSAPTSPPAPVHADTTDEPSYEPELVVPWRSSVVLPDVFSMGAKDQLAGMARFSGNTVSMIGYDLIPLTSPELRPVGEANGTAAYLSMVKHAHRVAGISRSAVAEFRGFSRSLRAQGLQGPEVREVRLSSEALRDGPVPSDTRAPGERPVMLCLGAQEPHKNQRAALHAAERLWHEGLDFEVHLAGGRGWSNAVLKPAIDRLVAAGRPLRVLGRLSDADLLTEMKSADFAYFASLHEGYGLPVAETLACGTPVITSNFGSQAEIGELGGCLLIDPRDDDDVTAGIRTLLTDGDELARLRAEAAALTLRTWDEYAADLWDFVSPSGGPA